jgi:uncharacterized membrane protein YhaH (DUF805 family)
MKWFIKVLKQYVDFSGRARRKEYWMYTLFYSIFVTVLFIIGNISGIGMLLYYIYALGMFLPSLAVAVRRLHDTDRSGWWLLLVSPYVCIVPLTIINLINGRSSPDGGIAALTMLFSILGFAGCIWLIVLLAKDGQTGDNQYGKDPKSDRVQILQTPSQDTGKATVSSGSGSMFWKIIQLLISIALIIAGASGQFVLRGTNSSELLIVFGCIWLVYDIYLIFNHKKVKEKLQATLDDSLATEANRMESPCTISLRRPSNMLGAIIGARVYLNGVQYGTLKNGKTVVMQTDYAQNILAVYANASDSEMTCSLRFDAVPGGHVQITFKYVGMKLILEGVSGTQQPTKRIVPEDSPQPYQIPQPVAPPLPAGRIVPEIPPQPYEASQPVAPPLSSGRIVPDSPQPYQAPQLVAPPLPAGRIVPDSPQPYQAPQPVAPSLSAGRIVPEIPPQPYQAPQPVAPPLSAGRIVPDVSPQPYQVPQPVVPPASTGQIVSEIPQPVREAPQPVVPPASFLRHDDGSQISISVKIPDSPDSPDSQESVSPPPPKKKMYRISLACLITGVVMILGFVLLTQTNLLSNPGQKTMSGDLIIEHESAFASGTFYDINVDDWSVEHLPGYVKQSRLQDLDKYLIVMIAIGSVLVVVGIVLSIIYKRRKAGPKTTPQKPSTPPAPANVRNDKPRNSTPNVERSNGYPASVRNDKPQYSTPNVGRSNGYPIYTGTGVCDVCNCSLTGVKAYIVPNSVFYGSPQWRAYFKRIGFVSDADIERMRINDRSQGSAVCENCIHMF